jgi:hypothetical protein
MFLQQNHTSIGASIGASIGIGVSIGIGIWYRYQYMISVLVLVCGIGIRICYQYLCQYRYLFIGSVSVSIKQHRTSLFQTRPSASRRPDERPLPVLRQNLPEPSVAAESHPDENLHQEHPGVNVIKLFTVAIYLGFL